MTITQTPPAGRADSTELAARTTPWPAAFPWNTHLGQLFDSFWHAPIGRDNTPAAEVLEDDGNFVVEVDLPGIDRKDIKIDVTGRRLLVHAARQKKERTGILRHTTRVAGEIDLEMVLPAPIDDASVTAEMTSGVLTIRLPKTPAAKTTRVDITQN